MPLLQNFNRAYHDTFPSGRLTVGLMTPMAREPGRMAHPAMEIELAKTAEKLGSTCLWTRDVPVMIPQPDEAVPLDDPFVWLAVLGAHTTNIALGTAAAVLPLRHPLHLAKSALSLNRLTEGRFILGLGSGDREAEFAAFGERLDARADSFRARWRVLRSALSAGAEDRAAMLASTGGYPVLPEQPDRIPMLVIGSARQSLQWTAANAEGWASYHRDEPKQQGRVDLWNAALSERAAGSPKPFVQSLQLDLLEDASAPPEPIYLGLRTGSGHLVIYFQRMHEMGVAHVLLNLVPGERCVQDVLEQLGSEVIPHMGPSAGKHR